MASIIICDFCGKEVNPLGSAYRKVTVSTKNGTPQRTYDMHEKCASAMTQWIRTSKEKSSKFKEVV